MTDKTIKQKPFPWKKYGKNLKLGVSLKKITRVSGLNKNPLYKV